MPNLGAPELIIILLIAVLVFGGAKLPKLARSLREAKDEFEKGSDESKKDESKRKDTSPKALSHGDDDKITLSKSELDALLAERELKAKRD